MTIENNIEIDFGRNHDILQKMNVHVLLYMLLPLFAKL